MPEESNTNTIPPVIDTATSPVETPPTIETIPVPAPASEPIAPASAEATADKPAEADNAILRLLAKAKEKIQFRKQVKLEKIMVFAKAQGGITNDQTQKLLRVSDATATRYLAQLTKNGRLRLVGKSKAARYIPVQ